MSDLENDEVGEWEGLDDEERAFQLADEDDDGDLDDDGDDADWDDEDDGDE